MAKKGGNKGKDKKVVAKNTKKTTSKKYTSYVVTGDTVERKNSFCPKCGEGVIMANHKNRKTCGTCGYTEFKSSTHAEPIESKE